MPALSFDWAIDQAWASALVKIALEQTITREVDEVVWVLQFSSAQYAGGVDCRRGRKCFCLSCRTLE